jgi:nitrate reductase gamma subunit
MTSDNQNNDSGIWSAEFIIQLIKEVVAALLGLAIVIYTLILAYNTVILAGDPKMTDAKDILMLMLGLAGVVVGYYFGRVPADARATQAQEQANAATAQAEQVTAQAHAVAEQIDHVLEKAAPVAAEARGSGASRDSASITPDLRRIRDELRAI